MNHTVKVIFGKEQVLKIYNNENFTEAELKTNVKFYVFHSIQEKLAFIKGINESIGWNVCCIPEFELQNFDNQNI